MAALCVKGKLGTSCRVPDVSMEGGVAHLRKRTGDTMYDWLIDRVTTLFWVFNRVSPNWGRSWRPADQPLLSPDRSVSAKVSENLPLAGAKTANVHHICLPLIDHGH